MSVPIIFCHYSNSKYLPYVLEAARITNPDKNIVLLGDSDNQWLGNAKNIHHYYFKDYQYGTEIETFDQVYRLIQGKKHGQIKVGRDWVNFVFKRWFYIYNFIVSQNIGRFWHFDSDNMILDSLAQHEKKFVSYDCTEQCNGICMNGFISNPSIVLRYIKKINELFQNEEYLKKQQKEFDELYPEYAFTEMRAYKAFKEEENVNSVRLNSIIEGSTFDDCICQDHYMEMEKYPPFRLKVKKVYFSPDGTFYCFDKNSNKFIKMNSLNLSWVPIHFFETVLLQVKKQSDREVNVTQDISQMPTLCGISSKKYYLNDLLRKIKAIAQKYLLRI